MKILFIAPFPLPITGQSLAVNELYLHMENKVQILKVDTGKVELQQGLNSLGRVRKVFGIIKNLLDVNKSADGIYFNVSQSIAGNLKDLLIYLICYKRLGRMVIHLHGGAGMRELLSDKHPVLRAVNAFFLRRLGGVIVLGERLRGVYSDIVDPSKLHAIPNFAQDQIFVETEAIETKFKCVKPLRLLFLSNLLPGKGHQELLSALASLPPETRDQLHADFAGGFESADEESKFRKQAAAVKVGQLKVHGVVHGQMKRDLLSNAHLFCLPTYYPYEGQPISILEAYASGCAVITTDHSGIFDTFTPGLNGLEVQPSSPESIALAIQRALAQPQELQAYARTNLEHAQMKYRAFTHVRAIQDVIFSVANK